MSQGRREPWAYITVSNPRMPQRALSPTYTFYLSVSFSHHLSTLCIAKSEVILVVPRLQKVFFSQPPCLFIYCFCLGARLPTLCVLINVTLTWTTHFGSWRSRLMPAWISPLPISERAGRSNEEWWEVLFLQFFIYIYFYSNLSLARTGSARSVRNKLSAFESFLESKMCDQSQIEAASIL